MEDQGHNAKELADYLAVLRQRWAWVALPLLALPALALYSSLSQPDRFQASAEVLTTATAAQDIVSGSSQNIWFRNRLLENEISLAQSDDALAALADTLGRPFAPGFSVSAVEDSDVLTFRASAAEPEEAALVANVAAETYVDLKRSQSSSSIEGAVENLRLTLVSLQQDRDEIRAGLIALEDALASASIADRSTAQSAIDREESRIAGQLTLIDAQISATAQSITELELSEELAAGGTARIVAVASVPTQPANTPPARNVIVALVIGAIVGAALALVKDTLDNKIRTTADLEALGLTPLGSIPKASNRQNKETNLALVCSTDPDSPQAQAHQKVQTAVRFLSQQDNITSVLITSAKQGEGKTTVSSNLAISSAQSNTRTAFVDVDLRRPRVHKVFDLPQTPGITTVVVDERDIADCSTPVSGLEEHLAVLPSGGLPPHPASFISSHAFTDVVKQLTKLADLAVFDAPPLLPVADTLSMAPLVDRIIIVAYANDTSRRDLATAVETVRSSGGEIMGAVLVGAAFDPDTYYYEADEELVRL